MNDIYIKTDSTILRIGESIMECIVCNKSSLDIYFNFRYQPINYFQVCEHCNTLYYANRKWKYSNHYLPYIIIFIMWCFENFISILKEKNLI